MTEYEWKVVLSELPEGLTLSEVTARLGEPYHLVREAIRRFYYPVVDGRKYGQLNNRKLRLEHVDWSLSNVAISRKFKVSRERVRVLRMQLGFPFVESRGRPRKHFHASKHKNQTKCQPIKKQINRSGNSVKS